jgi:hypothetical protein
LVEILSGRLSVMSDKFLGYTKEEAEYVIRVYEYRRKLRKDFNPLSWNKIVKHCEFMLCQGEKTIFGILDFLHMEYENLERESSTKNKRKLKKIKREIDKIMSTKTIQELIAKTSESYAEYLVCEEYKKNNKPIPYITHWFDEEFIYCKPGEQ